MLDILAGGLVSVGVHIGKAVWDRWWSEPDLRSSALTVDSQGVTQFGETSASAFGQSGSDDMPIVFTGSFQIDKGLIRNLNGDELALLLVIDENPDSDESLYLFAHDLADTFEISLVPGAYSIYAFVVDGDAPSLEEAVIWACGFPQPDPEDDPNPMGFEEWGTYDLDVYLWDADRFTDIPLVFGQLIEADDDEEDVDVGEVVDMAGTWILDARYEEQRIRGRMFLDQDGVDLTGYVLLTDHYPDGSRLIVEQTVEGTVLEDQVEIVGTKARVKKGPSKDYYLDTWQGQFESDERVSGVIFDTAGETGDFVLERP